MTAVTVRAEALSCLHPGYVGPTAVEPRLGLCLGRLHSGSSDDAARLPPIVASGSNCAMIHVLPTPDAIRIHRLRWPTFARNVDRRAARCRAETARGARHMPPSALAAIVPAHCGADVPFRD